MTQNLCSRLEQCYTGAVYDVLRALGHSKQVLPSTLRPVGATRVLAGPVFTMEGHPDSSIDGHESLLLWTAFLSKAPAGHVVVCQPHDSSFSHMGELSAETLQFRDVRGYIVDGGCRDTDFIVRIDFRVFCRYVTPMDIVGRWKVTSLGEPVVIGDVPIRTGDYVLADRDGIVVIPFEIADEVITSTERVMQTENQVRKAILQGVDPQEAYIKYGKF